MSSSSLMQRMRPYLFRMPVMLTCHEVEEFLLNYYEGKLTKLERAKFDFYIMICRECRDYMKAYQNSIALG